MFRWLRKIRIGILHAAYHRNMKLAEQARKKQDIVAFKKYVYRAEDAWKKLILTKQKLKIDG